MLLRSKRRRDESWGQASGDVCGGVKGNAPDLSGHGHDAPELSGDGGGDQAGGQKKDRSDGAGALLKRRTIEWIEKAEMNLRGDKHVTGSE